MIAATEPRLGARLLVVDPNAEAWSDADISDLPGFFKAGDLLVLNDAATLPASLSGRDLQGNKVEIRLLEASDLDRGQARVVVFGSGDWRTPTEHRQAPALIQGTQPFFGPELIATIIAQDPRSERLVSLHFNRVGAELIHLLYHLGRPVQYSYMTQDLPLSAVQTAFATRPWAMEMPSAARPLDLALLARLRLRGVEIATLTHAASLSSIGDEALDALLPFPERYEIPERTHQAIQATHAAGGRVIAAGTTVTRALEGAARQGNLSGETDLILDAGTKLQVVDGLLSNMHGPGESHFRVLATLAAPALLQRASLHAEKAGYLAHEFGDATLVLAGALGAQAGNIR